MQKSDSLVNLTSAVIKVMADVKGIEKNLQVGSGQSSYKGVADQDVKKIVGDAMQKHGLTIFPVDIEETTNVDTWDEKTQYGDKRKQSVFTKVTVSYLLCHESGEYITLKGYGHGVDSQDKSAGKATTYALKYALLYTFMVPTGAIDDADSTHSDDIKAPVKQTQKESKPQPKQEPKPQAKEKPVLTDEKFDKALQYLKSGHTMTELKRIYTVSEDMEFRLDTSFNS
jgi:hypothetical protein